MSFPLSALAGCFGSSFLFSVYYAIPFSFWFGHLISAFVSSPFRVSIDDRLISIKSGKNQNAIPWSSFAAYGSAKELPNHFWIECGRGTVWIPKRAFLTESELTAFRLFVADKMGVRCHFNATPHLQD